MRWNCQGAGEQSFGIHCLGLKLSYNPHVMVVMETRVSEHRVDRIIPTLGFSDRFRVPSVGFAGDIWVLWNSNVVTVDVLAFSTQAVHAIISFDNIGEWMYSAAYASLIPMQKSLLWNTFHAMSHHMSIPWLVAGVE